MTEGTWPSPRHLKSWTDSDGKTWRRVGDHPLRKNAVRRLIHDASIRVILFHGMEPSDVDFDARESLWHRIESVLRGKPTNNPLSDFVPFKFRDADGNVMLAIEESC
jgi:hypothetical protein